MNFTRDFTTINYKNNMGISGCTDEFFCFYLNRMLQTEQQNILVVVNSLYEANKLYTSLSQLNDKSYLFPMDDFLTSEAIAISPDLEINRLETLELINTNKPSIIVTNLMGYLRFLPTPEKYSLSYVNLEVGKEYSPEKLYGDLLKIGYKRDTIVTKTGEVGLRGYIIDVFPIGEDDPLRIEFFGDEIESLRYFDADSQMSKNNLKTITIKPCSEYIVDENLELERKQKYLSLYADEVASIYDYMDIPITVFKDYEQLETAYSMVCEEITTYKNTKDIEFKGTYMFDFLDINPKKTVYYYGLNNIISSKKHSLTVNFSVKTINSLNENIELITNYIKSSLTNKKTVLVCLKEHKLKSFKKNINFDFIEATMDNIKLNKINLLNIDLNEGFLFDNFVILTEKELYKTRSDIKKYKTKFKYSTKINDLNKLDIGDYVVHDIYGIGIYNGIKKLTQNNMDKDYIEVLYKGTDKLYIPVEKIELLSKFSAKEGVTPRISKMGGIEWKKTKARVSLKIADLTSKLLNLYAEREAKKGYAFSKDSSYMKEFESEFPYKLTGDQQTAIKQIKEDMERPQPMDRLLCGDVGFGKTEVAFVAAFKAILDSKQVLFLCPTTILSSQHYENAKERFKNFPVTIALLNRFTTQKEKQKIIEGLKKGTIDLVFGTHRLLSDDVKPNDLGLLVVDEEQRFGVIHKEKIKTMKTNVDVLTLTATPIPRTLQMSITGIRSLSLIETAPVNRYPVQTYVIEENDQIIKDAIYKELSRNGQIFILYNKVETIEQKVINIQKLVPDAKIVFAHGQLNKSELENRMFDFINHKYDILICTTIIETGIDIPNVNTLIILDADRFGLSQLYQIRGRVGRSNKFAYAYLMYQKAKVLTETAMKRLNVIKEFTELGSGFSIATRDLSIRGAGDILGSEQAGFIDSIGVDLYLKMLNHEVLLRGGKVENNEEELIKPPLLNVSTHIKDSYVQEDDLKIEIHRKINEVNSKEKFDQVKRELTDRFGKINKDLEIYMYEEWFENLANKIPIKKVMQTKNYISIFLDKEVVKKVDMEKLFMDSFEISPMFRFKTIGSNVEIILDTIKLEKHPVYYLVLLADNILNKNINSID